MAKERVLIRNISPEHLGFKHIFLRKRGHRPDNGCYAIIDADKVDESMETKKKEGKVTITPYAGGEIKAPGGLPPRAKKKEKKDDDTSPPSDEVSTKLEPKKGDDLDKQETTVIAPHVEPKKSGAEGVVNLKPPPTPNIPSVTSGLDGSPSLNAEAKAAAAAAEGEQEKTASPDEETSDDLEKADGEEAEEAEETPETEESSEEEESEAADEEPAEEDEAEAENVAKPKVYNKKELKAMKLIDVRKIIEKREIQAESTNKNALIEAILDHQNLNVGA
jgi:hypothetical protein